MERALRTTHRTTIAGVVTQITAIGLALVFGAGTALAQDRAGTAEFGIQLANISGEENRGINGASIDVANDTAIGIVGGYNFTNKFYVGAELTWADPAYRLERVLDPSNVVATIDAELDVGIFLLKAGFNFFDGPFTPFVEAGAGWIRVDSNVADGAPTTGCWWDPWWGYVCTSFYDTYSDTRTGYTYAAGIRWDISDGFLLRASYGLTEMDSNYAAEDIELDELRVDFGWKF
jgi:opacity protein-like surface antigen